MSLPYFLSAVGEIIAADGWASTLMNGENGSLSVTRAVVGSTTSVLATRLNSTKRLSLLAGSVTRSRLALTALASNVVPSWNFTPFFSLNV